MTYQDLRRQIQNAGLLDLTDVIPGFSLDVGELLAPLDPDWVPDEG